MLVVKLSGAIFLGLLLVSFVVACDTAPNVLNDQSVTLAGGGGGAEVSFKIPSALKIEISLTASTATMEPYGFLEYPDGSGKYYPPLEQAKNGASVMQLALDKPGDYRLTVFDGSNQGGKVAVKITMLK